MKKVYLIITLLFLILGCEKINKEEKIKVDEKSKYLISKELKEFTIFAIHLGKAFNGELPVFRKATEMTNIRLKGIASKIKVTKFKLSILC